MQRVCQSEERKVVKRTVEWRQALDEGGDGDGGLVVGNEAVDLKQVPDEIRTPANDEN